MIEFIRLKPTVTLDDYASWSYLAGIIHDRRQEAERFIGRFKGRSVFMLNSTAHGGGVAEMMPLMVEMLNELGITTHWVVMKTERAEFFQFTKRLHNLIHGEGEPVLTLEDRELYETVNRTIADELRPHLKPGDVLVVHDPQPLAAGAMLRRELDIRAVWRCHIGLDVDLPATRAAWTFLRRYAEVYDHSIFSAPEYIPDYLAARASVIYPGIDPLSPKNRFLPSADMLTGILCNAGLVKEQAPVLTSPFLQQAQRLQSDGHFGPATVPDDIGFLFRPIVAEISRWDRLKGFGPLMEGFVRLKQKLQKPTTFLDPRQRRRLEIVRLVLAGPDPNSIQDDPEGRKELETLCSAYCKL